MRDCRARSGGSSSSAAAVASRREKVDELKGELRMRLDVSGEDIVVVDLFHLEEVEHLVEVVASGWWRSFVFPRIEQGGKRHERPVPIVADRPVRAVQRSSDRHDRLGRSNGFAIRSAGHACPALFRRQVVNRDVERAPGKAGRKKFRRRAGRRPGGGCRSVAALRNRRPANRCGCLRATPALARRGAAA